MFREYFAELFRKAVQQELTYEQYLLELAQREYEVRRLNKIERLIKSSRLPLEKTFDNFEFKQENRNGVPVGIIEGYIATWDLDRGNGFVKDQFVQAKFITIF